MQRSLADQTRRKIAFRILPLVFILYMIAYLDRANVAFGKLPMSTDLGFSDAVFGFGAGIFFLGYFLLEIPGTLIVEKWSARRWIARILLTWGLAAIAMGFIRTSKEFYLVRFFLGAAEAGFFPGIIVYLTHWFSKLDRARATAVFMSAAPLSLTLGAPLSAALLGVEWFGVAGWRWMFILEGLPAIIAVFFTLRWLIDHPRDAKWLEPEEREWIESKLNSEKAAKRTIGHFSIAGGLRQPRVWLLALAYFLLNVGGYGFIFFLPSMIKSASGLSVVISNLCSSLPFGLAVAASLLVSRSSDRTGERRLHACAPMLLAGLLLPLTAVSGQPFAIVMIWLSLTGAMVYSWCPPFWAIPTLTLGESAAAASIGLINSIGNLGGFVGPSVMGLLLSKGLGYPTAAAFLGACYLISAALVFSIRFPASPASADK